MDADKLKNQSVRVPMTRREMLAYAQVAALVLLIVGVAVMLLQVFFLQPQWIDLGSTGDVKPDQPVSHTSTLRDGSTLRVWVVYTRNRWFVFDGHTPVGTDCLYQWEPVTGRFEDPCSGAKFSLTGKFVDPYGGFAGKSVQNLNQYPVSVRDNRVLIDGNRVNHAEPFIAPGLVAELCK